MASWDTLPIELLNKVIEFSRPRYPFLSELRTSWRNHILWTSEDGLDYQRFKIVDLEYPYGSDEEWFDAEEGWDELDEHAFHPME